MSPLTNSPTEPEGPLLTDADALDRIAEWLRDPDWGVGMLEDIAQTVELTGRDVESYPDQRSTWDRH
jgi:hypothetical protein